MERKQGFYEKYVKRALDIICSLLAIVAFWWMYLLIAVLVRMKMGAPVLFRQPRPGMIDPITGRERIFDMLKFRTMTDARDENDCLLPDEQRLSKFGKMLRTTSLDELPEVLNILKGDMSVIGPRPQLVRDMVFMSEKQRMRHTAKPGLSGLAQVMGRNAITWEEKFAWDMKYIEKVSFTNDLKIVWWTIRKAFFPGKQMDQKKETEVAPDFGDYMLQNGQVSKERYEVLMAYAETLVEEHDNATAKDQNMKI